MNQRNLSDYSPIMKVLLKAICEKWDFTSDPPMTDLMRNPRLIVAFNHSTPISWIPAMALLAVEASKNGGADRVPRGIVDRFFYSNPLTLQIAKYITQSDKPLNFEELVHSFKDQTRSDLVIMPEGANTFFGDLLKIQDFRSSRFIELSILCQAPVLLAVHRGSEIWAQNVKVPKSLGSLTSIVSPFFGRKIHEHENINIPIPYQRISSFRMKCELWVPPLYESDLSSDPHHRKQQISELAEQVKDRMQEMFDSI